MNNITNRAYQPDVMSNYIKDIMHSNINYIPDMDKSKIKMMTNNQILEPYQGFIKGNMFKNLYDGYKNFKPSEINPTNEKEAMLEQWQQYNFALTDLNLYLDVYPNDREASTLYNKYLEIQKQIADKYESMYGPLTTNSKYAGSNSWEWIFSNFLI